MGRCWTRSWRFQRRFEQFSKYEFAISLAVKKSVKILLVCRKDIVDSISVINLA